MRAVLKVNCASIRERIKEAGYRICPCCEFEGAVWLTTHDNIEGIHGEGFPCEDMGLYNVEDVLADFEKENPYFDFGYDVKGFINWCKEFKKI